MKKIPAVLVAGTLLSNCGGGGGGGSAVPAPVNGSPAYQMAKAQVSIKIPNSVASSVRRGHQYIPANAASVRISVITVNGSAPPAGAYPDIVQALSPTAAGCSNASGSLVCTIVATLPVANVTLSVSLYQSTDGSGTALATNTITTSIGSGTTTNIALTLGGVPANITLGGPIVVAADGTTKTLQLPVTVTDASGATIIAPGTYSAPVLFGISGDPNGALTAPPLTGPAQSGQTTEAITYNSAKALTSATITAAIANGPTATTQINPLVYQPTTLTQMLVNGASAAITVSEAGYAGAFTLSGGSPNTIHCVPTNCTPGAAGGQVTIQVQPASIAGLATLSIKDTNNIVASVPLAVSSTGGTITLPGNPQFAFDALTAGFTGPANPVAGSDGRIWYSEQGGSGAYIGAMSTSGVAANYAMPTSTASVTSSALGPDGNTWFVDQVNDQIDVASPAGAISVNSTNGMISTPDVIAEGPDNQMWIFGTRLLAPTNAIVTMAPNGNTSLMSLSGPPLGIIDSMLTGPDGNMWFTQVGVNAIGMVTPAGVVTLYNGGLTGTPNPGLAIGADGCVWFTVNGAPGSVAKIRPSSGTITEYSAGISGTNLSGVSEGADGNVWFFDETANMADRVTTSGTISPYSTQPATGLTSPVLMPNGQLWFANPNGAGLGWLTY